MIRQALLVYQALLDGYQFREEMATKSTFILPHLRREAALRLQLIRERRRVLRHLIKKFPATGEELRLVSEIEGRLLLRIKDNVGSALVDINLAEKRRERSVAEGLRRRSTKAG